MFKLIQTPHLKAVTTSRIKLGTCEIRCLNWGMVTVSSVTINTCRYARKKNNMAAKYILLALKVLLY